MQFGRKEEDRCALYITYFFLPNLVRVRINSSPDLVRVCSLTNSTHSREGRALQTKSACMLLPPLVLTAAATSTPSSRNHKHESPSDPLQIYTAQEKKKPLITNPNAHTIIANLGYACNVEPSPPSPRKSARRSTTISGKLAFSQQARH
jgi:hypothetical protein